MSTYNQNTTNSINNINNINNVYEDLIKTYNFIKTKKEDFDLKLSIEYKKILSYTKTFDMLLRLCSNLTDDNSHNINYRTIKVINESTIKLLVSYGIFYLISRNDGNKKIGFDFEFNEGKIAIWQFSFYEKINDINIANIFIIDPYLFENEFFQYKNMIIELFFVSNTKKILHGGDSLDLPYIFNILFNNEKKLIKKFIKNVIDTRFLCEFIKIINNENNKKCSIYDALLYFKVITQTEYEKLNNLTISMGPVQDVNWNLYNMSSYHLKYTLYDVLFLNNFVKNIYKKYSNKFQLKLINEINRSCFYEKYGFISILSESKQIVDLINNYFIIIESSQIRLIEIYDLTMKELLMNENLNLFLKTLEINNFKKFITMILKRIIYVIVLENYTVYENKKTTYKFHHSYLNIFDKLLKYELNKLAIKLIEFTDISKRLILVKFK